MANPNMGAGGYTPERNIADSVNDISRRGTKFRKTEVDVEGMKIPLVGYLHGERIELIDLKAQADKFRGRPERRKGTAQAYTLDSFIALCQRNRDPDSVIFGAVNGKPHLLAVFDYNRDNVNTPADVARYGQHRLKYDFPVSDEWKVWDGANGEAMEQTKFAAFIEDHIVDLSVKTGDDVLAEAMRQYEFATPVQLMELSRGLVINESSNVKNIVNLQNGVAQIAFEEQHRDINGEPLKIPGAFMLSIPMFDGGENVRIPCRLRYRKAGGHLVWLYQMFRASDLMRNRIIEDMEIASSETGLRAFLGAPEA